MPTAAQPDDQTTGLVHKSSKRKLLSLAVLLLVAVIAVVAILANHTNQRPSTTTTATQAPVHSGADAAQATAALYDYYLPLKAQKITAVGDNPNAEPALVQAIRASKQYLTDGFYHQALKDYMSEYQATGKVTKDDLTCGNNTAVKSTSQLATTTAGSAQVWESFTNADGSATVVSVYVDRHTLKINGVHCPSV